MSPNGLPLKAKRDDAARHQQHACHAERIGQFSREDSGAKRDQKQRCSAGDRVSLTGITFTVGAHEKEIVPDMK